MTDFMWFRTNICRGYQSCAQIKSVTMIGFLYTVELQTTNQDGFITMRKCYKNEAKASKTKNSNKNLLGSNDVMSILVNCRLPISDK